MEKLPENVCARNYCYSIWNMGEKETGNDFPNRCRFFFEKREKRVCKLSQKVFDLCCLQVI